MPHFFLCLRQLWRSRLQWFLPECIHLTGDTHQCDACIEAGMLACTGGWHDAGGPDSNLQRFHAPGALRPQNLSSDLRWGHRLIGDLFTTRLPLFFHIQLLDWSWVYYAFTWNKVMIPDPFLQWTLWTEQNKWIFVLPLAGALFMHGHFLAQGTTHLHTSVHTEESQLLGATCRLPLLQSLKRYKNSKGLKRCLTDSVNVYRYTPDGSTELMVQEMDVCWQGEHTVVQDQTV